MKTQQKVLTATEFKAKCLKVLDHLGPNGVIVTKRGRPVAKVVSLRNPDNTKLIGCMKGKVYIKGNILSTGIKWRAQS